MNGVEAQITNWRDFVAGSETMSGADVEELEGHLRDQIDELESTGLTDEEAFLIAVKRLGSVDELTREFGREHVGRLWKQLLPAGDSEVPSNSGWLAMFFWALAAAASAQIARLSIADANNEQTFWLNMSLFFAPLLAGFFAQRRGFGLRGWLLAAAPFVAAGTIVNLYPLERYGDTIELVAMHLPELLWFVVGIVYVAGEWRIAGRRMDFVRFTGEWVIYYSLIALGGGILTLLTTFLLDPSSVNGEDLAFEWMLPSGAAAAIIVAAWLVEAKQRVVENMAPVLTAVFTPLFAVVIAIACVANAVDGLGGGFDRDLLVVLDALLLVVLALVMYALSARESSSRPGLMDKTQLVAVVGALLLDLMVLVEMLARIGDLGFTPNRAAALGINLILFVNLVVAACLSVKFIRGRVPFDRLTRWQMTFLPVFAVWSAIVVIVFPPVFGFN